jgi:hypothetical protein
MDTTTPAPWASIGPTWFQIALNAVPNFFKFSVGCEDSDRERLAITTCTESEIPTIMVPDLSIGWIVPKRLCNSAPITT